MGSNNLYIEGLSREVKNRIKKKTAYSISKYKETIV